MAINADDMFEHGSEPDTCGCETHVHGDGCGCETHVHEDAAAYLGDEEDGVTEEDGADVDGDVDEEDGVTTEVFHGEFPDKASCRKALLERRDALSPKDRALQSLALGRNVAAFLDAYGFPNDITVGVYAAMEHEIDLTSLVAMLFGTGAHVCYPCVHNREEMDFYELVADDFKGGQPDFLARPNRFHSRESVADYPYVDPSELDLLIIPGVGFDKHRNRMGYGAGCYDRYLEHVSEACKLVGVCFDVQLIDELPVEDHDHRMDFVITPSVAF